jgi:geranylgeranyl diphosphate synthase type 3
MDTFFEEIRHLFIGQSFDLYWTQEGECPSEEQYLAMVGHSEYIMVLPCGIQVAKDVSETGGLFRLIVKLMIKEGQLKDTRYVLSTARMPRHRPIAKMS